MSAKIWHSLLPGTARMAGSLTESSEAASWNDARQRVSSQATITSTTRMTSTNVTRDRGIALT
jgi:hypothetical protein